MNAEPLAPSGLSPAVRLVEVVKEFRLGEQRVEALDGLSLDVEAGSFVAVVGPSGSGKSTLLNLIAGIDSPTSGTVWVAGRELSKLSDDQLTLQRRETVGMIYQFFNLLPTLTVRENVALPALLGGAKDAPVLARAEALIQEVGVSNRLGARPHTLSGGEMQRVAIARALIHEPKIVLADEPTGNLDSKTAADVLQILHRLCRAHGTTVMLVTHSMAAARIAERVIELRDGKIVFDGSHPE